METNTKKHNDWTFEKVTNIEHLYEIGFWNSFIIRNHFSIRLIYIKFCYILV